MNYTMYFRKLKNVFRKFLSFLMRFLKRKQPKISLLIPFSSTDSQRQVNFKWLQEYWKHELPNAEIIIGVCKTEIFCKAEALNDAVSKSKGKVLVILDADAYLDGSVINNCADRILEELDNHLWYVPYRNLYRLTQVAAKNVTDSDPSNPFRFSLPVDTRYIENAGNSVRYGHRYGAMIMMFPRQAYKTIGRFDERFKGWGGEDVCLLRALDTLYGKHKTTDNNIYHLWHPFYGNDYQSRRWAGQSTGGSNWDISREYSKSIGNPTLMKKVVAQGAKYRNK